MTDPVLYEMEVKPLTGAHMALVKVRASGRAFWYIEAEGYASLFELNGTQQGAALWVQRLNNQKALGPHALVKKYLKSRPEYKVLSRGRGRGKKQAVR